jgi:hypothetical protein
LEVKELNLLPKCNKIEEEHLLAGLLASLLHISKLMMITATEASEITIATRTYYQINTLNLQILHPKLKK